MTGCDEIRLDLPAYLRRELPEERMSAIGSHLSGCAGCARELRELDEVAALAAMAPLEHDPLRQLESRVLGLLELEGNAAMHEEGAARRPGRVASSL